MLTPVPLKSRQKNSIKFFERVLKAGFDSYMSMQNYRAARGGEYLAFHSQLHQMLIRELRRKIGPEYLYSMGKDRHSRKGKQKAASTTASLTFSVE